MGMSVDVCNCSTFTCLLRITSFEVSIIKVNLPTLVTFSCTLMTQLYHIQKIHSNSVLDPCPQLACNTQL